MTVKLKGDTTTGRPSSGFVTQRLVDMSRQPSIETIGSSPTRDRLAVLIYPGVFQSEASGVVTVSASLLRAIVDNHNSQVDAAVAQNDGVLPLKHCPPVQLDHSSSSHDTVGRLVGRVYLAPYQVQTGETVNAVYGVLRIIGSDNVERVDDGRWSSLSLGFCDKLGIIREVTITPFPAVADATLLSKKSSANKEPSEVKEKLLKLLMSKRNLSQEDAEKKLEGMSEDDMKKLSDELDGDKGDDNEKEQKLSGGEKDDDKQLGGDKDKDETNLADKKPDNDDGDGKTAKLMAAKGRVTELSRGFAASVQGSMVRLAQGRILTRLSKLRAEAKITPAEIKKIDIVKLSAAAPEAIDLVLQTYENRQPVIMVGQYGSTRKVQLSSVDRSKKLSDLEAETRQNMTLLRRKDEGSHKKLSTFDSSTELTGGVASGDSGVDLEAVETEYNELCKMIDGGDGAAVKDRLKRFLTRAMSGASGDYNETSAEETEKQLSALAEDIVKMRSQFNDLVGVVSSIYD